MNATCRPARRGAPADVAVKGKELLSGRMMDQLCGWGAGVARLQTEEHRVDTDVHVVVTCLAGQICLPQGWQPQHKQD